MFGCSSERKNAQAKTEPAARCQQLQCRDCVGMALARAPLTCNWKAGTAGESMTLQLLKKRSPAVNDVKLQFPCCTAAPRVCRFFGLELPVWTAPEGSILLVRSMRDTTMPMQGRAQQLQKICKIPVAWPRKACYPARRLCAAFLSKIHAAREQRQFKARRMTTAKKNKILW